MDLVIGKTYRVDQFVGTLAFLEGNKATMNCNDTRQRAFHKDLFTELPFIAPQLQPVNTRSTYQQVKARVKEGKCGTFQGQEICGYIRANLIEELADKFFNDYLDATGVQLTRESKNVHVRPAGTETWANALQFTFTCEPPANLPVEVSTNSDGRKQLVRDGATAFCWELIIREGFRIA